MIKAKQHQGFARKGIHEEGQLKKRKEGKANSLKADIYQNKINQKADITLRNRAELYQAKWRYKNEIYTFCNLPFRRLGDWTISSGAT